MKVGGEEGAAGAAGAASGEGRARLVAIGNGGVGAAERWRKMVQFEGEVFVSPTLDAYKDMQLVYGSKPVSKAVYCGRWCVGFWKALSIVCCNCAFGMATEMGDVQQQGGVFVFNGKGECTFVFRATDANEAPDYEGVFAALDAAAL